MRPFRLGTPWAIVAGFLLVGMGVALFGHVRFGGWLMASGLLAGALLRAALPDRLAIDISIRSRTTDIAGYCVLAFVVLLIVTALKL